MTTSAYKVTIIVDPNFGDRLFESACKEPIWIVDTPVNRKAAESVWAQRPEEQYEDGVTTFLVEESETPEEWCANIIDTVDLHHGEEAHQPPYSVVEVIGTGLTKRLRQAFSEFAMTDFLETSDGFRANRSVR